MFKSADFCLPWLQDKEELEGRSDHYWVFFFKFPILIASVSCVKDRENIYMSGNNFRNLNAKCFGNLNLKSRTVKSYVVISFYFAKR